MQRKGEKNEGNERMGKVGQALCVFGGSWGGWVFFTSLLTDQSTNLFLTYLLYINISINLLPIYLPTSMSLSSFI